jgi:hypothetical protein
VNGDTVECLRMVSRETRYRDDRRLLAAASGIRGEPGQVGRPDIRVPILREVVAMERESPAPPHAVALVFESVEGSMRSERPAVSP